MPSKFKGIKHDKLKFNILVVGQTGCGKSAFLDSFLRRYSLDGKVNLKATSESKDKSKVVHVGTIQTLTELGNAMELCLYESSRFGDAIDSENAIASILSDLHDRHREWRNLEACMMSEEEFLLADTRIHCCFYLFASHRLKQLDVEFMTQACHLVPIIPIVTKADVLTVQERNEFMIFLKKQLSKLSSQHADTNVIYDFKGDDLSVISSQFYEIETFVSEESMSLKPSPPPSQTIPSTTTTTTTTTTTNSTTNTDNKAKTTPNNTNITTSSSASTTATATKVNNNTTTTTYQANNSTINTSTTTTSNTTVNAIATTTNTATGNSEETPSARESKTAILKKQLMAAAAAAKVSSSTSINNTNTTNSTTTINNTNINKTQENKNNGNDNIGSHIDDVPNPIDTQTKSTSAAGVPSMNKSVQENIRHKSIRIEHINDLNRRLSLKAKHDDQQDHNITDIKELTSNSTTLATKVTADSKVGTYKNGKITTDMTAKQIHSDTGTANDLNISPKSHDSNISTTTTATTVTAATTIENTSQKSHFTQPPHDTLPHKDSSPPVTRKYTESAISSNEDDEDIFHDTKADKSRAVSSAAVSDTGFETPKHKLSIASNNMGSTGNNPSFEVALKQSLEDNKSNHHSLTSSGVATPYTTQNDISLSEKEIQEQLTSTIAHRSGKDVLDFDQSHHRPSRSDKAKSKLQHSQNESNVKGRGDKGDDDEEEDMEEVDSNSSGDSMGDDDSFSADEDNYIELGGSSGINTARSDFIIEDHHAYNTKTKTTTASDRSHQEQIKTEATLSLTQDDVTISDTMKGTRDMVGKEDSVSTNTVTTMDTTSTTTATIAPVMKPVITTNQSINSTSNTMTPNPPASNGILTTDKASTVLTSVESTKFSTLSQESSSVIPNGNSTQTQLPSDVVLNSKVTVPVSTNQSVIKNSSEVSKSTAQVASQSVVTEAGMNIKSTEFSSTTTSTVSESQQKALIYTTTANGSSESTSTQTTTINNGDKSVKIPHLSLKSSSSTFTTAAAAAAAGTTTSNSQYTVQNPSLDEGSDDDKDNEDQCKGKEYQLYKYKQSGFYCMSNVFATICDISDERSYGWGSIDIFDLKFSDLRRLQKVIFETDNQLKALMDSTRMKSIMLDKVLSPRPSLTLVDKIRPRKPTITTASYNNMYNYTNNAYKSNQSRTDRHSDAERYTSTGVLITPRTIRERKESLTAITKSPMRGSHECLTINENSGSSNDLAGLSAINEHRGSFSSDAGDSPITPRRKATYVLSRDPLPADPEKAEHKQQAKPRKSSMMRSVLNIMRISRSSDHSKNDVSNKVSMDEIYS